MQKADAAAAFRELQSACAGKRVAIATHNRADPDAIASAFALSQALPGSVICSDEEMSESARLLAGRLGIGVRPLSGLDRKGFEGLVVTDTSAYTLIPGARGWRLLMIIDHHQPEGRDMEAGVMVVDTESPSASEIVANMLPDVGGDAAFALAVGIIADAARFKSARAATFSTLSRLMERCGAPYFELLSYAEPDPKPEAKIAMLSAMKRVEFLYSGGYIIATSEVGSNESDAASLIAEAADVAFIAKWKDSERETRISARARKSVKIPLNRVLARVAEELGGAGGGHAKAAGAALKSHTALALEKCVEVFTLMAETGETG